jgi:hypothetical protein
MDGASLGTTHCREHDLFEMLQMPSQIKPDGAGLSAPAMAKLGFRFSN